MCLFYTLLPLLSINTRRMCEKPRNQPDNETIHPLSSVDLRSSAAHFRVRHWQPANRSAPFASFCALCSSMSICAAPLLHLITWLNWGGRSDVAAAFDGVTDGWSRRSQIGSLFWLGKHFAEVNAHALIWIILVIESFCAARINGTSTTPLQTSESHIVIYVPVRAVVVWNDGFNSGIVHVRRASDTHARTGAHARARQLPSYTMFNVQRIILSFVKVFN